MPNVFCMGWQLVGISCIRALVLLRYYLPFLLQGIFVSAEHGIQFSEVFADPLQISYIRESKARILYQPGVETVFSFYFHQVSANAKSFAPKIPQYLDR